MPTDNLMGKYIVTKSHYFTVIRMNELDLLYTTTGMNDKYKIKGKKASHKRLPTVCIYLYKVQKQAKINDGVRSQDTGYPRVGV